MRGKICSFTVDSFNIYFQYGKVCCHISSKLFFNSQLGAQGSVLLEALKEIPGVEVIGTTAHGNRFGEAYEIRFTQPLDHNNPEGATFTQRMFIGHLGFDRPMVLSTSGYSAANLGYCAPAGLLKSNMIRVEHRFLANQF